MQKKASRKTFTNEILEFRVVDGDTVEVTLDLGYKLYHKTKIRLEKIDAPELHSSNPEEREAAKNVSKILNDMLALSMTSGALYFDCTEYDSDDRYGRILGNLYDTYTKRSIPKTLIQNGIVRFYDGKSARKPWTNEELKKITESCNNFISSGKINSLNNDYEHDWN